MKVKGLCWPPMGWTCSGLAVTALVWHCAGALAARFPAGVTRFATDSGVRVVFRQEPESPTVAMAVAVRTLPAEYRSAPGIGGVVASALFGANSNLSREGVARAIAYTGDAFQASWSAECAMVSCVTTPAALSDAVWIVAQALKNADMDVETASQAVRNLLATQAREASDPVAVGAQAARAKLFGGHPYGRPPFGTPDSIRRIPRQNLLSYYRLAYVPQRTVIAVCGNLDVERVRRVLSSHLVDYENRPPAHSRGTAADDLPEPDGPAHLTAASSGTTAAVLAAYRTPGVASPRYPALRVLATLLGGGKGSRLFRSVRDARGVGYVVGADIYAFADAGVLYAFAEVAPRKDDPAFLERVEKLVVGTAESVLESPPTEAELERARRLAIGIHRAERQRGVDRAVALARAELLAGGWSADEELPARMAGVSLSDLMETAREVLTNRCVVVVRPDETPPLR